MNQDESKIEDLKEVLYSRTSKLPDTMILDLHQHETQVKSDWEKEPEVEEAPKDPKKLPMIFLMGASVFFVLSILFAIFMYFSGGNTISSGNIAIDVVGPLSIGAGEPLVLDIAITNNNETPLILADLLVEYPKGSREIDDKVTELARERISIGTIEPHQTIRKTIGARLFDEEGNRPEIKYSLEYKLESSGSTFTYDGAYPLEIGAAPVALTVNMLEEVNADQEFVADILVTSNSSDVVKDLLLKLDTPTGFEFKSANPVSLPNKLVWNLGDLEPKGERKITIRGTIVGSQSEEKTFRFSIGGKSKDSETVIEKPFINLSKSLIIKQPFLAIDLFTDGGGDNSQVVQAGKVVQQRIDFQNNLKVPITDAVIEVKLKGDLVLKRSVDAELGFYRANEDKIVWTKIEQPKLASLTPSKSNSVIFNYMLAGAFAPEATGKKNQEVLVDITVKGKRLSENNVPETITSTVTRKLRVASDVKVSNTTNHFEGPFENTGVYPPRVDQKTEFAISWSVTNSLNPLENARIEAVLPTYVTWLGKTTPTSEKVFFDEDSRKVVWEIGKILPGGGTSGSLRQLSFQVALTPSLSQIGDVPNLVNLATFSARDTFAMTDIKKTLSPSTVAIPTEPQYEFGQDEVRE